MLTVKLAFRTLLRRKGRMALIGALVMFGTLLITLGGSVASAAAVASRQAIIGNFTGDFIVYSDRSKELPSPFAFTTPLPPIKDTAAVAAALEALEGVEAFAFYTQNYGLIQAERDGRKYDLPFIFYAVDGPSYGQVFNNIDMVSGTSLGADAANGGKGVLISQYQNERYRENFGLTLESGESLTVLGITEGGVNTERSVLAGVFEPRRYKSVFNYINFMDAATYGVLYNYTGVAGLPDAFNAGLAAALGNEDSIFDLALDADFGKIDTDSLVEEALSGYTVAAVKLKDGADTDAVMAALAERKDLGIKTADWKAASGFYAQIASALQAFIFLATALIFLVVTLIFMNTLIINVMERTSEIGSMRAMGADKSFIRNVFLAESLMLNLSAALVAMALSAAFVAIAGPSGLPLPETVSQFLIGGGSLPISLIPGPFAAAFLIIGLVSILAVWYPVRVATAITPLKAMSDR